MIWTNGFNYVRATAAPRVFHLTTLRSFADSVATLLHRLPLPSLLANFLYTARTLIDIEMNYKKVSQ